MIFIYVYDKLHYDVIYTNMDRSVYAKILIWTVYLKLNISNSPAHRNPCRASLQTAGALGDCLQDAFKTSLTKQISSSPFWPVTSPAASTPYAWPQSSMILTHMPCLTSRLTTLHHLLIFRYGVVSYSSVNICRYI